MGKPMEFEERPLSEGAHWRRFYDSRVLRWWHLPAKDITLTIETITELEAKVGRESKLQLMARFRGAKLPFALNGANTTSELALRGCVKEYTRVAEPVDATVLNCCEILESNATAFSAVNACGWSP